MPALTRNPVTATPAADPSLAQDHFAHRFQLETDCWDVHATEELRPRGFVLADVRSREHYERGHLPGAVNMPHWEIDEGRVADVDAETLFVVYCAGPHCNGAHRAALRLARLGRPVKVMVGGVTGWKDEGFELVTT